MGVSWGSFGRAVTLLVLLAESTSALAAGALAVGQTGNIRKDGLAIGFAVNRATKDRAEADALKQCLDFKAAPESTKARCKIVQIFEKQCLAVALDPKDGTPGAGWAVMATKTEADNSAMGRCRDTAGKSRADFCAISVSRCDGAENSN
jgi:uncharacterized protein DUF4189